MGYLSCNAESAIATCDQYNWDLTKKPRKLRNKPFKIKQFSYSDLHSATNGFCQSNFLGKGSHGSVYKALLDDHKLTAAVKKTTTSDTSCTNNPAENEIEILSRVRHPRLVNLLGFAGDSEERKLLVVEFMPNGSLFDLLHSSTRPPGWARRVRFSLQIAKAVQFLHSSNPPVIHRDIKSSNVLIDGNFNARLGDFGLALRGHVEDVRVKSTPPAGTLGYLDPSYLAPCDLSTKTDVFSFGILILEIISGRNAIDMNYSPPSVVDWAVPVIKSGDYAEIFDARIRPPEDTEAMQQLAAVAAKCVRSTASKRPGMAEVVECLKKVNKRMNSLIWNNLGRRVGDVCGVKCEPLDESSEMIKTPRNGSRRNRKVKVSSVTSVELGSDGIGGVSDRVVRSKSIGSVREIKFVPPDLSRVERRRAGLAVKIPMVRLSKSRSMGVLQSTRLLNNNNNNNNNGVVKNPNVKELEESKLLDEVHFV
ncbi:unnamed protein product [Ilex paraguariensis]|uniref:Protein kinase domain-containing protein n=1 Tax=Ilex paraguariensis TaxID=185542 RepID=A0ABC8RVK7_9AQUA